MAQAEPDPLDRFMVEQVVERKVAEIQNRFIIESSDRLIHFEQELELLQRTTIELRVMVVTQRIQSLLIDIYISRESDEEYQQASTAARVILQQRSEWFRGAFRETDEPIRIYNEWLYELNEQLKPYVPYVGQLLFAADLLPTKPDTPEE